jgi:hypothetical protein
VNKPLIVGESNPYGGDDYYALYPAPDGCSGHRLCCLILGMDPDTYLDVFERCNLLRGKWSAPAAREQARLLWERPSSPRFILLGSKVAAAFQVPFVPFEISEGGTMLVLPHPSGRNPVWGKTGVIERARAAVLSLAPELGPVIGTASPAM